MLRQSQARVAAEPAGQSRATAVLICCLGIDRFDRLRRVKCDETRPLCNKCLSTGRNCEGYPPGLLQRDSVISNRQLLPLQRSKPLVSIPPALHWSPLKISATDYERHAFEFFRRETAVPLQMISSNKQWLHVALQLGHTEPTVFYCMVAAGSAASAQLDVVHHTLLRPENARQRDATLQQYCKATAALQRYINTAVAREATIEPIMICCILFVVLEVFRDKGALASAHLRHGRRAISNCAFENSQRPQTQTSRPWKLASPETNLGIFSDLDQLYIEAVDSVSYPPPLSDHLSQHSSERLSDRPMEFQSIEHAKETLDDLINRTSEWRAELLRLGEERLRTIDTTDYTPAMRYCVMHCLSRTIDMTAYPKLHHQEDGLLKEHTEWLEALQHFASTACSRNPSLILMDIQHFASAFTLRTAHSTSEFSTDELESEFGRILNLIDEYIDEITLSQPQSQQHVEGELDEPKKSFSLERGVLPALFLICLKCRSREIRYRALALLRDVDRREGLWFSKELFVYAESLIHLEQQRAQADCAMSNLPSPEIPEAARFLDVVIAGVSYLEIRVVCGRVRHEAGGELEIIEYKGQGLPPLQLQPLRQIIVPIRTS